MKVGKYIVSDWNQLITGGYHYMFITDPVKKEGAPRDSFQIGVSEGRDGWKVLIDDNEFFKLYCGMTLNTTKFGSVDQAKQSVNLFLDKLSKLKAFI